MHPLSISRRRPDKRPYQHARAPEDADSSRMGYDIKENALQYYEAVECQLLAQVVFLQVITLMAVLAAEQRWGLSMDMCRYWPPSRMLIRWHARCRNMTHMKLTGLEIRHELYFAMWLDS
ncbi:hypothetical protein MCOR02_000862 [Pyricularia oryzae]|nr:hypothetical protein MCOR02_000862 [Pyricularia oryzae]